MTNNSVPSNSIWPNSDGNLGKIKAQIPDGITSQWPEGDTLVNDFVYKDGKLVGFVDSRALIINDEKTSPIPYDYAKLNLPSIFKGTMAFQSGERNKTLIDGCEEDAGVFVTPLLKELLGNVKFKAEHIKNENKLVVHTDRLDDEQLAEVEDILERYVPQFIDVARYNHHMEISWRDINKYANCVTYADMAAVNPNFVEDITSDGWWVYPIPKLQQVNNSFQRNGITQTQKNKITHFVMNCDIANVRYNHYSSEWPLYSFASFVNYKKLEEFRVAAITGDRLNEFFRYCTSLRVYRGALTNCRCGTSMFDGCILDKDSVLHIAENLCEYVATVSYMTNNFCLGIHVDHQNDDEVLAAISTIEGKGWNLTVQWNGTPSVNTASTFGLGTLIYAKVIEYEQPEGITKRMLDWGHYVTNPEGYETFRSVEAAREHFNLPESENIV